MQKLEADKRQQTSLMEFHLTELYLFRLELESLYANMKQAEMALRSEIFF